MLVLALALAGCRAATPPTEVVVTVDSAFAVPCVIDTLHVEIDGTSPTSEDIPLSAGDLPGSLTLVPAGAPQMVTVTVTGMRAGEAFATASQAVDFAKEEELELRFVLDRSCVPGPCPAIGVGGYDGLPAPIDHFGCGSAGYQVAPSLLVMRDACAMQTSAGGSVLAGANEAEATIGAMPFPFTAYGATVTNLWVGDNGYLAFSDTAPHALVADVGPARSLGVPSFPVSGVLAFWDDLHTGPQGICWAVSGTAPDRILWVTWEESCFASGATPCGSVAQGLLTFGVALQETTNQIYLGYLDMTAGGANATRANGLFATIGVTDQGPRGCTDDQCSTDGTCNDGTPCGYTEYSAQHVLSPFPTSLELDPR